MGRTKVLMGLVLFALVVAVGCSTSTDQENADSEEVAEAEAAVEEDSDQEASPHVEGEESEADESDESAEQAGEQEAEIQQPADPESDRAPGASGAKLWSDDGLESQYRVEQLQQQARESDMGHEPASTSWKSSDRQIPQELADGDEDGAQTPGALLVELVAAMGMSDGLGAEVWEQTLRVFSEDEDQAVGVVLQWGFKDDSLAGADLRVQMERGEAGWFGAEIDERFHCRRGISDDGMCL